MSSPMCGSKGANSAFHAKKVRHSPFPCSLHPNLLAAADCEGTFGEVHHTNLMRKIGPWFALFFGGSFYRHKVTSEWSLLSCQGGDGHAQVAKAPQILEKLSALFTRGTNCKSRKLSRSVVQISDFVLRQLSHSPSFPHVSQRPAQWDSARTPECRTNAAPAPWAK